MSLEADNMYVENEVEAMVRETDATREDAMKFVRGREIRVKSSTSVTSGFFSGNTNLAETLMKKLQRDFSHTFYHIRTVFVPWSASNPRGYVEFYLTHRTKGTCITGRYYKGTLVKSSVYHILACFVCDKECGEDDRISVELQSYGNVVKCMRARFEKSKKMMDWDAVIAERESFVDMFSADFERREAIAENIAKAKADRRRRFDEAFASLTQEQIDALFGDTDSLLYPRVFK